MSKVETLQITTPTDTEVLMTRAFDAPRRLVWEAFTTPEHLQKWMLGPEGWSMPVCEMELRPGGTWHYVWRRANGNEFGMTGTFREVTPPEKLVNTEKWGPEWPETLVTTAFEEEDGRTTVRQTILYPSKEARDAALKTGMADGASASFDRLEKVLAALRAR
jgi:uncharacterized protein YndB with AHSA1/START domain